MRELRHVRPRGNRARRDFFFFPNDLLDVFFPLYFILSLSILVFFYTSYFFLLSLKQPKYYMRMYIYYTISTGILAYLCLVPSFLSLTLTHSLSFLTIFTLFS